MLPRGSIWRMKSRGPSTKPWGTPCDRGAVEEVQLLMLMNWGLFVIYDPNQERAVPAMLRQDSRRERGMVWLMVLKAAVRWVVS